MYKIEIIASADRALRKINQNDRTLIAKAINKLAENQRPFGYKKLKGSEFYRIRIRDYRVIYQIYDEKLLVLIVRIGHRKNIYK